MFEISLNSAHWLLISIKNLSKNCIFPIFLDRLIVQVMGITDEADFLTQHF